MVDDLLLQPLDLAEKEQLAEDFYLKKSPNEAGNNPNLNGLYAPMRHAKATQTVIKAGSKLRRNALKKNHYGHASVEIAGSKVTIEDFATARLQALNPTASKILQVILLYATQDREQGEKISLELSLDYFIEATNTTFTAKSPAGERKAKSRFKEEFFNALDTLSNVKIKIEESIKGKILPIGNMPLMYYTPAEGKKDTARIVIIEDFVDYIRQAYLMQFYTPILQIEDEVAYYLHTEYSRYYNQPKNHVVRKAGAIPQARIFGIHTAIDWTGTLPTLLQERDGVKDEEGNIIKKGRREYTKNILDPLENALYNKNGMIKTWEWCKANGENLTDEEVKKMNTYEVLNTLYIKVLEVRNETEINAHIAPALGKILDHKEKQKAKRTRLQNKGKTELGKATINDKD